MFEVISGSDAYIKQYEELEAKKSTAEDQLRFMFSKKKTVVAERKLKQEQKVEAEKHMKMQQELVCDLQLTTFHEVTCAQKCIQRYCRMCMHACHA